MQLSGSRVLGSVVVAHGLSCPSACGIFPDQGLNPCPLHWREDSYPLDHQGSPYIQCFCSQLIVQNLFHWFCQSRKCLEQGYLANGTIVYHSRCVSLSSYDNFSCLGAICMPLSTASCVLCPFLFWVISPHQFVGILF